MRTFHKPASRAVQEMHKQKRRLKICANTGITGEIPGGVFVVRAEFSENTMNARSLFALKYSILPSTLYLEDNELVFCFIKRF